MSDTTEINNIQLEYTTKTWLKRQLKKEYNITKLCGDAGSRTYYRIVSESGEKFILSYDTCTLQMEQFIRLSKILTKQGVITPRIITYDFNYGLLLQSDFGDDLLAAFTKDPNYEAIYKRCIDQILKIKTTPTNKIDSFDYKKLTSEVLLSKEWYINSYCKYNLNIEEIKYFEDTSHNICEKILRLPYNFVHRDYHSRNIFILPENQIGIIDFQDAVSGPYCYDLVSLLRDYYNPLSKSTLESYIEYYYSKTEPNITKTQFKSEFHLVALQRHLKVLGIFCRLAIRDNKRNYLQYLPTVINYIKDSVDLHPEYQGIYELILKVKNDC